MVQILIAEDDPVSRRLLEITLRKWGYEVVVTCDGEEAWQRLQQEDAPRLAILDWMMPKMDGLEVCRKVRAQKAEPYTYLILLTAKGQKEDIVAGLESGADDYVTKPFHAHELRVRLRAGERILDLQAKLIEAREALRVQATHDFLTGLWNRAAIFDLLRQELARAEREKRMLAIAVMDLDHFKCINDTYGHLVGDTVLRETVQRIRPLLRIYDALGRYGGEEFLLVLPGCDALEAVRVAERIRVEICQTPIKAEGKEVAVTCSLGVAIFDPARPMDMDACIRTADRALYQAKSNGRNRVELAATTDGKRKFLSAHEVLAHAEQDLSYRTGR
ncbi:MAG: diguanylate cyclase [Nitrospinota bacterium]|nr:MAG: diguanylate cyclase [Nitrospinota bacterium]